MTPPTRYPLAWPPGWRRSERIRAEAKFSRNDKRLSVWDGVQRVLAELQRMGINDNDVVVSTNVETRLDGMPRSDRATPTDPGVAVYWQKGPVGASNPMKCMAIDRYDRVADNLAAVAATLEAFRAVERHGGGAVIDRAYAGFAALPAPIAAGMRRDWWVVLQCGPHAARDVIQSQYRRLAADHHPDRAGGTDARMSELNAARDEALKAIP